MKYNTKQEIFNKVWDHFVVKSNPKSTDELVGCRYYSSEGGCAIGCLIAEDKDKKALDNSNGLLTIDSLRKAKAHIIDKYVSPEIETDFLTELQNIHDSHFHEFESKMRALADSHGLKVPKAAKTK